MIARFALISIAAACCFAEQPFMTKEDVFPMDKKHNHASSILALPKGDLIVCWYRGSGERQADDVVVMASRKAKNAKQWTEPFVLADYPGFPDTNPTFFLDKDQRVWLLWQTIVANQWETAITSFRIADKAEKSGAPKWNQENILLLKPVDIVARVDEFLRLHPEIPAKLSAEAKKFAADKYFSRMGWMTRAHPFQMADGRILIPLYSDGYSFSLVGISDDNGKTFHASQPIVGLGNIQPSFALRKDGTLVAYMRDNGPAPHRVQAAYSKDRGETWTFAEDTDMPNSGTGLEVITLQDGRWLFVNNDTERGRHSLVVRLSDDEGKTWKWERHVELDTRPEKAGSFHYPSMVQAKDGSIHLSYSVFLNHLPEGEPRKTIRHAHFNTAWVEQGDPK